MNGRNLQLVLRQFAEIAGQVARGVLGEVMIAVRGGAAFSAYASLGAESYDIDTRVTGVDYFPPRTVHVAPAPA